ncbi:MAG: aminoacyl-tRNA hydrolase, partial [Treponema sp.]|nr:aminoacyl-tRNA hydrolase [Treponema sp.]
MNILKIRQSILSFAETSFSRSGGPGGQNVNKVNSKVTLKLRLEDIEGLLEPEIERIKNLLVNRISN